MPAGDKEATDAMMALAEDAEGAEAEDAAAPDPERATVPLLTRRFCLPGTFVRFRCSPAGASRRCWSQIEPCHCAGR